METVSKEKRRKPLLTNSPSGPILLDWETLRKDGKSKTSKTSLPDDAEAMFTVAYTSGSTGRPKGAVNTCARWNKFISELYLMPNPLVRLSFMSIAHVTERQQFWLTVMNGGRMAFHNDDMEKIFDEFALVQPTCLSAAPRFYDQIHAQFKAAVSAAKEANPTADTEDIKDEIAVQFRNVLGSRMQYCVIGGAASGPEVKTFIWKYLRIPVFDGYGTSEAGGIASNEGLYPGVEVKLLDCPEMGYTTADLPYPRGEIVVRTPTTIQGYYKDEEATSANFVDGWFRTGDIGEQTPEGKLRLIDRKKSLFKLVQGVFVAPSSIENLLLKCPFVNQIFVYGDTKRSNLVAIVVPNEPVVQEWWKNEGRAPASTLRALYDNPEVALKVQAAIAATARTVKLPAYEIPAAVRAGFVCPFHSLLLTGPILQIYLETEPFTSKNGLMTPSDKLVRHGCEKRYLPTIEELYSRIDGKASSSLDMKSKLSAVVGEDSELLSKLGTDSLSTVRLAHMIKNKLGVNVSLSTLQNVAAEAPGDMSIESLAKALETASAAEQANSSDAAMKAEEDSEMPLEVRTVLENLNEGAKKIKRPEEWKKIFLTGATGFLGFELMLQLLESMKSVDVVVAVRPKSGLTAKERLVEVARARKCASRYNAVADRIIGVDADLESDSPTLGVPGDKWNQLCQEIDCIFHVGAVVNWVLSYDALRVPNVNSTKYLIDMACSYRLKSLFYISTISTSLPGQSEGAMMPPSSLKLSGAYALSKWAAEKLVRRASYQGLPAFIFKPGMITGDSKTGSSNPSTTTSRVSLLLLSSFLSALRSGLGESVYSRHQSHAGLLRHEIRARMPACRFYCDGNAFACAQPLHR